MSRLLPAITLVLILSTLVHSADPPALKEALALEKVFQDVIQEAESSIACILVSRSDAYQRLGQGASPEQPGKLGAFALSNLAADDPRRRLDLADPAHVPEAFGSGIVIASDGLILTNYHVVRDATKVFVRLSGGKEGYADIHAADPRSDLAVLRLLNAKALPLKAITISQQADSIRKGQLVLGLAHPFAAGFRDGSPSASWGIVSNLRRRPAGHGRENDPNRPLHYLGILIQTDARLNLGCSGGALLDLKGELIGMTTALAALAGSDTPGGYAVPMTARLRRIVDVLKEGKEVEYGFLGVQADQGAARGPGIALNQVTPGSPAHAAGLQAGDRIVRINEMDINDADDLFLAVGTLLAGTPARLEIRQARGSRAVTVTLAKYHVPGPVIASNRPAFRRGLRIDYTSVLAQQQPVVRFRWQGIQPGVCVREVQPGSSAAELRLNPGTVITQVNGKDVHTPTEFYQEADKVNSGTPLVLTVVTGEGGGQQKVTVP
jgi:serine protease Do